MMLQIIIQDKMLNVQMYTQMGYTQAQVRKAYDYSMKNRIDMFDALQQIQNKEVAEKQVRLQSGVPTYSYLNNMKNFKISQFQIVYSKSGIKESNYARDELREPNTPVGLFNVSNCCYLNSLLQCYFLMGSFAREILQAEELNELPEQLQENKKKIVKNQYLLLAALKQMFSKMRLSSRRYLDPTPVLKNLVNSVGQKIQYGDQKDLNQINMEIVDRLSECLMHTKKYYIKEDGSPSKIKKRQNIKHLFYGEKVQFIQGLEGQSIVEFMGIILNPKHQNLLSALDAQFNYDVEIDNKVMSKHTFIRTLPIYLFFTINRTQYEKNGNQLLKNSQKLSFDFEIYLDQYLESNKQQAKIKNPKIKQLQKKKNGLKTQINHLDLMAQKLQQCRAHAKYLSGWSQKFPNNSQIQREKEALSTKVVQIQKCLAIIESRKQKYMLMYLFVHRGDAISGHYWGYGRNGSKWYRFDVNCILIKQVDILVDIQKSSGIPYAMVYAKDENIEQFQYPYFTSLENHAMLLDINQNQATTDYSQFISSALKRMIINQNIAMHVSIQKQKSKALVQTIIKDYKAKYNIVKSQTQKYFMSNKNSKIPIYSNFACYLESIGQSELMKYNLFQIALSAKGQINCKQLINNQKLLKLIQAGFRKKVKGKLSLRHFAIQCEPVEGVNYKRYAQMYLIGKKCLYFVKKIAQNIKGWPKINKLYSYLEDISNVLNSQQEQIYIKNIAKEMLAIMLIDLASKSEPIKMKWVGSCEKQNGLLREQLKLLDATQISQQQNSLLEKTSIAKLEVQKKWNPQSLQKIDQKDIYQGIKNIISKLQDGMKIYKLNTKQNKVIKNSDINKSNSKIQQQQSKQSTQSEDLI